MAPNSFRRGRRSKLNQTSNIAERVQDTLLKTQAANQKRASDAISNLMVATLGGAKTKYTVERAKIVEENFVSLVNATSDFPITISDMQQRGRKRQRDSIDRKSDPQVPAAPKTKKQKTVPTPCLTKLQPQPLQMVFQPHPDEDRSNGWYRNEFRKLFSRIETFACEHFGVHDVSKNDNLEPWTLNFSPEFLRYVEVVADEDPYSGGWDPLLKNTIQRQWLVVAILSRIIVVKVFSTDLWGADEEEKDLILGIERAFLGGDGFRRTILRAETVRTILSGNTITKHFHEHTAKLTAQLAILLQPLTEFLNYFPPTNGVSLPPLEDQYQALHNIIACAGYLSLCMRLSPTIFHFPEVNPSEPYNEDDHCSVEAGSYSASKEVVTSVYTELQNKFEAKEKKLKTELAALKTRRDIKKTKKKEGEIKAHRSERQMSPGRSHRGLVKISIWPNIRRYEPGSMDDKIINEKLQHRDGMRIIEISKSAVLCYFGVESRVRRANERMSLESYILEKNPLFGTQPVKADPGVTSTQLLYAAALAVPMAITTCYSCDVDTGLLLNQLWNGVAEALGNVRGLA